MNKKRKPGYAKFDYKDPKKRKYRYLLRRIWDENLPQVTFVMLNPSTAGAGEEENDPTIKKCIDLARSWNYGSLEVVNLFAYIATEPKELNEALKKGDDIVGHNNNLYILSATKRAESIIVAWGAGLDNSSAKKYRVEEVLNLISCKTLYYLVDSKGNGDDLTKNGHPRHPLQRDRSLDERKIFIKNGASKK
ncbi:MULTISPECIES: DUF1643 domain-containing protein [Nostocales]|jgi:hypothetical protein|uniref:DUF1643 domain-containing protein n=2 Tax=Dolichospermum TaxID=748770 RepID=A0A480ABZ2_9CYAN|nr:MULTISPECIES: DUF1643 domain-containing protein [Nostocales]MBD2268419.1 DUF1643 domain-containing protein [Anabaena sp. FACHB-1391]MBE9220257.1 DUF1643 domain-containing protein [Dolichospermum flos-aquae LEGE 04289]GCL42630.1 hypothetical protein NIES80_23370 [Dolichospermum planctonicum]